MVLAKNVPDQALALALAEPAAAAGHDAGGVLPPVLQYREGIVYLGSNVTLSN